MFLTKKELDAVSVLEEFFLSHMERGEYRLMDCATLDRLLFLRAVLNDQWKQEHARMREEKV